MSAIDDAFVKLYSTTAAARRQRGRRQPLVVPPPLPLPDREAPAAAGDPALPDPLLPEALGHTTVIPPPHFDMALLGDTLPDDAVADVAVADAAVADDVADDAADDAAGTDGQPLTAELAQHPLPEPESEPPLMSLTPPVDFTPQATSPRRPIEPRLEVDRFLWPEVCRQLPSKASARFDRIASELISAATRGRRVVAVAGCHREEGTTTILQCIARALAQTGCRALVADVNARRPALARQFGIAPEAGWDDVLGGQLQLPDVLIRSLEDRFVLLPMRKARADGEVTYGRSNHSVILELLAEHYDLVLLDAGSLLDGPCAALGGGDVVEAAILVRDVRTTSPAELGEGIEQLEQAGIAVAGVVENFARRGRGGAPQQDAA